MTRIIAILSRFFSSLRSRGSRGISSVELALILPAVMALAMGVIETGNMFTAWLTVHKAAQTGTRFAATGQGEEEGTRLGLIIERTEDAADTLNGPVTVSVRSWPNLDTSAPGVLDDPGDPCHPVEVSATYNYRPITPIVGDILPEAIPLTGRDRKINEPWQQCS